MHDRLVSEHDGRNGDWGELTPPVASASFVGRAGDGHPALTGGAL